MSLRLTSFISFLVFLLLQSCSFENSDSTTIISDKLPNVLFIIADDLSAEALGAYGNTQCLTPNIDKLSFEGLLFSRAFCQFPVCGPSRAALLSGLYPQRSGIMGNGQSGHLESMLDTLPTLPEYFRLNGYHTARCGKIYHMRVPGDITAGVDGPDHPDSWSERHNFKGKEWMTQGIHEHLSNRTLRFDTSAHYNLGFGNAFYTVKTDSGDNQPDYRAASKAIEIMKHQSTGSSKPFFMAVGFIRPHVPLVAPMEDFARYPSDEMKLAPKVENDLEDIPSIGLSVTTKSFGMDSTLTQQKVLAAYYASVTFLDRQVGRLLEALEEQNLSDNTIVIFMSDHGYHLGEHTMWQKLSLHEESLRIPLIIKGPGIPPGQSSDLVEQIDIYPTLSMMAGLQVPNHLQGRQINSIIQSGDKRNSIYSVTNKGATVRSDEWAFIEYNNGERELYDMKNDPLQYNNLVDINEYDLIEEEMRDLLLDRSREATETIKK